jgi:hypothetical protein
MGIPPFAHSEAYLMRGELTFGRAATIPSIG